METTQKILLAASLILIFILLLFSQIIQPKTTMISNITLNDTGKLVKIFGQIISQNNYEGKNFQILTLSNESNTIEVTTNSKTKLELNDSQSYAVIGRVSEYNKTIQITAEKIEAV